MSTVNWPADRAFAPRTMRFGATTPKSGWQAFFTGQVQSISHAAERLRCTLVLKPCNLVDAGRREAFFMALARSGDWVALGHVRRPIPQGTLRGTPTVASSAVAGATTLSVQTTAGATLLAGDILGGGGQLLMTGYAGATADGSGVLSMPLVLPLRAAISSPAALTWNAPTATWQLEVESLDVDYTPGRWQDAIEIPLREAY